MHLERERLLTTALADLPAASNLFLNINICRTKIYLKLLYAIHSWTFLSRVSCSFEVFSKVGSGMEGELLGGHL